MPRRRVMYNIDGEEVVFMEEIKKGSRRPLSLGSNVSTFSFEPPTCEDCGVRLKGSKGYKRKNNLCRSCNARRNGKMCRKHGERN